MSRSPTPYSIPNHRSSLLSSASFGETSQSNTASQHHTIPEAARRTSSQCSHTHRFVDTHKFTPTRVLSIVHMYIYVRTYICTYMKCMYLGYLCIYSVCILCVSKYTDRTPLQNHFHNKKPFSNDHYFSVPGIPVQIMNYSTSVLGPFPIQTSSFDGYHRWSQLHVRFYYTYVRMYMCVHTHVGTYVRM